LVVLSDRTWRIGSRRGGRASRRWSWLALGVAARESHSPSGARAPWSRWREAASPRAHATWQHDSGAPSGLTRPANDLCQGKAYAHGAFLGEAPSGLETDVPRATQNVPCMPARAEGTRAEGRRCRGGTRADRRRGPDLGFWLIVATGGISPELLLGEGGRVRSRSLQSGGLLHGLADARLLFHGLTPMATQLWRPFGTNKVALRAATSLWLKRIGPGACCADWTRAGTEHAGLSVGSG
jgi:hypothetical protein